jgi:superfamily I DNA/RNA helicase
MFLLSDPRQRLVDRGFVEPSPEAGWVCATLTTNVRNSNEIARLARRFLDGASAPSALPPSKQVSGEVVVAETQLIDAVRSRLSRLMNDGVNRSDIMVVASDSRTRDLLRRELTLGRAEQRNDGLIACETAHRAKGLEAPVVITAIGEGGIEQGDFYVAVTRAILELHIVGPEDALGLVGLA